MYKPARTLACPLWMVLILCLSQFPGLAQTASPPGDSGPHERKIRLIDALNATYISSPRLKSQGLAEAQIAGDQLIAKSAFNTDTSISLSQDNAKTPLTPAQVNENAPYTSSVINTHTTTLSATVSKLFPNGVTASGVIEDERVVDNETQLGGVNFSSVYGEVTLPLLKGRGRAITAATSDAAGFERRATQQDNVRFVQTTLASTARTYWALAAAQEMTAIAAAAEVRRRKYVDDVKAYIKADRVPANDLNLVQANLSQRSSDTVGEEQNRLAQQEQLKIMTAIGTNAGDEVLVASDPLPSAGDVVFPKPTSRTFAQLLDRALAHHQDYQAALTRISEAQRMLQAKHQGVLPSLDLDFRTGYSGLTIGRGFSSFVHSTVIGVPGPNLLGSISYAYPAGNDAAHGALLQSLTTLKQNELTRDALRLEIQGTVETAVNMLYSAGRQLQLLHDATVSLEKALAGDQIRYRAGLIDINDLLITEDRLTSAASQEAQARLNYADAIIALNDSTGDLTQPAGVTLGKIDSRPFILPVPEP